MFCKQFLAYAVHVDQCTLYLTRVYSTFPKKNILVMKASTNSENAFDVRA